MIESQRHSYHLVDPSPWPISGSLGALATTVGGVMYMHPFQGGCNTSQFGPNIYPIYHASSHSSLAPTVEIGGTLFSIVCGIRQYLGHLTKEHHVGFEAAAWYWHFVDVVRLFPFVSIYWWGGI
ncbi:hypothetical protein AAC387_Pa11g0570 [Persea americana]